MIIGPMRSGKTMELKRRIDRRKIAKMKCAVIKSVKVDIRLSVKSSKKISIHNGDQFQATFECKKLMEIEKKLEFIQIIGIDEGQFFVDLIEFCDKMALQGKVVIVAGLDGNWKREPFTNITGLISKSKKVDKLLAICMKCGEEAPFTMKTSLGDKTKIIEIDDNVYESVCLECYNK